MEKELKLAKEGFLAPLGKILKNLGQPFPPLVNWKRKINSLVGPKAPALAKGPFFSLGPVPFNLGAKEKENFNSFQPSNQGFNFFWPRGPGELTPGNQGIFLINLGKNQVFLGPN